MIGKVSLSGRAAGVINYCYFDQDHPGEEVVRGELLYANEVWDARLPNGQLNVSSLAAQFQDTAALNRKTDNFIWHQIFSFLPEEKVSNETMVKIARDFAKDFGFENNQYLVFRHHDKDHEHFHIVANRIDGNGKNTASDRHNYERIQVFARQMEQKYGLTPVENHIQKIDHKHNRENQQLERMKKAIDQLLPSCHTLSELSIALAKKGIVVHLGRGIAFSDQRNGTSFKGSDLGREYSRAFLEKRLGTGGSQKTTQSGERFDGHQRQKLRETIDRLVGQTKVWDGKMSKGVPSASLEACWKDFGDRLKKEGITLKVIKDDTTGRIKGAAYQTNDRRYVNSRELGETYTVKSLALRFGRTPQELEDLLRDTKNPKEKTEKDVGSLDKTSKDTVVAEQKVKMITGANAASETKGDLAKIAEAQRSVDPKKQRRRIK